MTRLLNRASLSRCADALRRSHSAAHPSAAYLQPAPHPNTAVNERPSTLTRAEQAAIDRAIRVDQAGEVAANWIYQGQLSVLGKDRHVGPIIQVCPVSSVLDFRVLTQLTLQNMWEQEKKHLKVMNKLQVQHRVRPTILTELAKTAGFALGAATALIGREAAMACTEAVETVIGEHYDEYVSPETQSVLQTITR